MRKIAIALIGGLLCIYNLHAQNKKSGITNFSINGFEPAAMNANSDNEPDLYFIGDNSTRLSADVRVSDEIVKYTEEKLKEFLGYELVPANLNRPSTVLDQMGGHLMVIETVSDKKAFKQLGYDEVIEIQCMITSAGKSGSNYKPCMEIVLKITGKDGKTTFKKKEKVKIEEKIPANLIELKNDSGLILNFKKSDSKDAEEGITATQLFDWYKQALSKVLIK